MVSSLPGRPFILGIPFLRAFVAKFDRSARTIGLAQVPLGSSFCASCNSTSLTNSSSTSTAASLFSADRTARVATLASRSLGASSLASTFGSAETQAQMSAAAAAASSSKKEALHPGRAAALQPAELLSRDASQHAKLAKLEAATGTEAAARVHAGSARPMAATQLASHGRVGKAVLPEQTILLGSAATASGGRFKPPQMKLTQLRVPPWVKRAHREWHQKQ